MRWLVTGAGGMLGTDAQEVLAGHREDVTGVTRADLDITDAAACLDLVRGHDVVLNCAAWTAVDDAEYHEPEAFAVNAVGAANLARASRAHDARMVHISTDYVFAGDAIEPYSEGAPVAPRSAYGRTKAAGEWAVRAELPEDHLILRTGWLYGASGHCFPKTITRLLAARGKVPVVNDQIGQPTWTRDVVDLAVRLIRANNMGIHHATASGLASWWEFARTAALSAGLDADAVTPTSSAEFPRPAPRPKFSALGHDALSAVSIEPIDHWQQRWERAATDVLDTHN